MKTSPLLFLLLQIPSMGKAQEIPLPEEEQPVSIEQVCEQSAENLVGTAREAYMADCLANWTNFTPQEDDSSTDQRPALKKSL